MVPRPIELTETNSLLPTRDESTPSVEDNGEGGAVVPEAAVTSASSSFVKLSLVSLLLAAVVAAAWRSGVATSAVNGGADGVEAELGDEKAVYVLETEGKKKKEGDASSTEARCDDGGYSKRTLQKAYELPFVSLFRDTKGMKKHEASSVIVVGDYAYAVCDNSWAISRFDARLQPFSDANVQVGDPAREDEDSGFEALFHVNDSFYAVRESVKHEDKTYHAIIEELSLDESDYSIVEACPCEFEFEGDSKGFEGAIAIQDLSNELVVLGLCEGNYCSEERKFEKGNGRLVAMRRVTLDDGSCQWATIRTIKIPESADFRDYSAITMDATGRVAISSQEESQLWVGSMTGLNEVNGLWDVDSMEFDQSHGKIYDFPKNDNCQTIYCNIEGVHWLNPDMIIAVSDKMKSRGKQDYRCFDKDQSVHVFVLP